MKAVIGVGIFVGLLHLAVGAFSEIAKSFPEIVTAVMTKTDDCFQCGMIEGFGNLNLKVSCRSEKILLQEGPILLNLIHLSVPYPFTFQSPFT